MADKVLQSITFPNLSDRYTIPQIDSTLSESGKSADAKETGDALATKAEIDGYYEEMTVGDAEQLVATQFIEDSVPYLYRTSGGSADIGNREYDKIVGGSVVWNQLIPVPATSKTKTQNNATIEDNRDGSYTIFTESGGATGDINTIAANIANGVVKDHKYCYIGFGSGQSVSNGYYVADAHHGALNFRYRDSGIANGAPIGGADTDSLDIHIVVKSGAIITSPITIKPQVIDLTAMFGTAIADYIYSLESATAGAGIAKLKSWGYLTDEYIPYDAGTMKSVEGLVSHDMVGFNQWDEETETGYWDITDGTGKASTTWGRNKNPIYCIPNTQYCFSQSEAGGGLGYILFYDADGNYLNAYQQMSGMVYGGTGQVFTTPAKCYQMKFYTYATNFSKNICINLSWSGTRNGEYEPYVKHSYPLDSSLTLRGIPKLDASNNLYYDGDTYAADGTVTRKYGVVDLGTLSWSVNTTYGFMYAVVSNGITPTSPVGVASGICTRYTAISDNPTRLQDGQFTMSSLYVSSSPSIEIMDADYTDASAFKTAMSGVYLIYELATPTTEQATPYNEVQIVDDWGTEEYVTDSIVPVGHNTRYPQNLRDKLQHLPNLASSDGFYLIQQTGTQMELVAFHIPKATGLADGTYTLKATVSDGTPTYTWEADTNE